ncbi:hypothetical protein [Nocardia sp. IFM 10818]
MNNPFDNAPAADTQEDAPVTETKPAARPVVDSDGKIVVTFKAGAGFDAPWIVIHADSIADAAAQIGKELYKLMEDTAKAAEHFKSLAPAKAGPAARPAPAAKPAYQQAPANAPECPPGWEFKSGVNKTSGKAWKGYFPPRGSDEKPMFF